MYWSMCMDPERLFGWLLAAEEGPAELLALEPAEEATLRLPLLRPEGCDDDDDTA